MTATLSAATPQAERALGGKRTVRLHHFPFRVGRESREGSTVDAQFVGLRLGIAPQLNDLYLIEPSWVDLKQVSREHFAIDVVDEAFVLIDRGSACGTIVSGRMIGGNRHGGRTELRSGDTIVVGREGSEYVFRFDVDP